LILNKVVVHFGGGALGRGLVVPLLDSSGYEVVLVDVDENLLGEISKDKGYMIDVTDESKDKRKQFISVKDTVSSISETEKLNVYLNEADIITTAVRRENLIHVVRSLLNGLDGSKKKTIICAENIENVGKYFNDLLEEVVINQEQKQIAETLIVPNTIVDRICSAKWPEEIQVSTEKFHELAIDKNLVRDSRIKLIPAIENIDGAFARKRLMVNTYADASSFMALAKGKKYLHEAILDKDIQLELKPYFDSFKILLEQKYNYSAVELEKWQSIYKERLSNSEIKRDLTSVARNLWQKMTLAERFIWPLYELLDLGIDVENGISVLVKMIRLNSQESNDKINEKLGMLWNSTEKGHQLYVIAQKYL
jgi:mannitol-1-phosphate 5-dehydrogenase